MEHDRDSNDVEEEEEVHVTEGEGKIDKEGKEKEPLDSGQDDGGVREEEEI